MSRAYDALAPYYRDYAARKSAYLTSVDRYILMNAPHSPMGLLDVGAGDGVRGMGLAQRLGIGHVVLCEPSAEMAARCRERGPAQVWQIAAEDLPEMTERFDVILCLWNVLGHLASHEARLAALKGMARLLSDRGRMYFDVNNRHNASAYGWLTVMGRLVLDYVAFDERRGDASFNWQIGEQTFPARGHLFTPAEIERIVRDSGLYIADKVAVDYASGKLSRSSLRGQLLYQVKIQK